MDPKEVKKYFLTVILMVPVIMAVNIAEFFVHPKIDALYVCILCDSLIMIGLVRVLIYVWKMDDEPKAC